VTALHILLERDATPDRLAHAWSSSGSFALLPDRLPISRSAIDAALRLIPPDWHRDHYVLLTSGSTGHPKFVLGSKDRTMALADVLHRVQVLEDVREAVVALPLMYSYAFVNQFIWSLRFGRGLRLTPRLADPMALVGALSKARDAMLCLTGAQVPMLLRAAADMTFPGVTRLNFAGGRFPQELLPTLSERFPHAAIFNNYGCAEALPRLTCRPAAAASESADIGWPLPGVELRSAGDSSLEFRSPFGAVGLIEAGTFRLVEPTDWLPTGDLGVPGDAGRWRLLGRRGEVFKRYGEKVSIAALLASVLQAWPGEAAFHLEHDRSGEIAHVLTIAPIPTREEARAILGALRLGYPRAAWPVRIVGAAALPRLPNGKVDLAALPNLGDGIEVWKQHL